MLCATKALLSAAVTDGYAIPSFCVWNAETVGAVLATAQDLLSPVILMAGPGEFNLLPPRNLARIARAFAADVSVPVGLHLDHGDSIDLVKECIDSGFTSVMLDYSKRPYQENADGMKRVVELAAGRITVEGELGLIGSVDNVTIESTIDSERSDRIVVTDPSVAHRFVQETGVDSLAVAFGNAHGIYRTEPAFDFALLHRIAEATCIPLVWHGGSGTSADNLQEGIRAGIAKVNVASEIVREIRRSLLEQWNDGRNLWIPAAFAESVERSKPIVRSWIEKTGSAGQCAQ